MKEIRMQYGAKIETFRVRYEDPETGYIFAECITNPAGNGFFTRQYISQNLIV